MAACLLSLKPPGFQVHWLIFLLLSNTTLESWALDTHSSYMNINPLLAQGTMSPGSHHLFCSWGLFSSADAVTQQTCSLHSNIEMLVPATSGPPSC